MEHVVFFTGADGANHFRRAASLDEAVWVVEHLRNSEGVEDSRVFALAEVPVSFKQYFRVEVAGAGEVSEPNADVAAPVADPPVADADAPAADAMPEPAQAAGSDPAASPVEAHVTTALDAPYEEFAASEAGAAGGNGTPPGGGRGLGFFSG